MEVWLCYCCYKERGCKWHSRGLLRVDRGMPCLAACGSTLHSPTRLYCTFRTSHFFSYLLISSHFKSSHHQFVFSKISHLHSLRSITYIEQLFSPSTAQSSLNMSTANYDTWLAGLRQENESLPSIKEQQAFLDYLNHKTTTDEAASEYTHIVTNAKHPDPESLWILLWQTAEEWPETHNCLIGLLKAISRLPPISRESSGGEGSKLDYWSTLPEFEFGLREYWDGNKIPDTTSLVDEAKPS